MFDATALRERLEKVPHYQPEFVDDCMQNVQWYKGFGEILSEYLDENKDATQSDVFMLFLSVVPSDELERDDDE